MQCNDDDAPDWAAPASDECSACGIPLGDGRGRCRRARGTTICLDCATLYDPPEYLTPELIEDP